MDVKEQRIRIAEACGWTMIYRRPYVATLTDEPFHESAGLVGTPPKQNLNRLLPDYLADLNAMHEAEKMLEDADENGRLMATYAVWKLPAVCDAYRKGIVTSAGSTTGYWLIHATAAQRAEAFLKTIGKWTD